ncbi:hypothetical protein FGO68_gene11406 [Halteria grandinella]|uniref:Uncharacterized protein n=1 Tax=Halteria grandinella TaxID=5974 RepID=A0A8J8SVP1_HALGN|nr:hypothetical protein FGO68_gene11406 [Halteria grandinella]
MQICLLKFLGILRFWSGQSTRKPRGVVQLKQHRQGNLRYLMHALKKRKKMTPQKIVLSRNIQALCTKQWYRLLNDRMLAYLNVSLSLSFLYKASETNQNPFSISNHLDIFSTSKYSPSQQCSQHPCYKLCDQQLQPCQYKISQCAQWSFHFRYS